jgi:hypothetical protein
MLIQKGRRRGKENGKENNEITAKHEPHDNMKSNSFHGHGAASTNST